MVEGGGFVVCEEMVEFFGGDGGFCFVKRFLLVVVMLMM